MANVARWVLAALAVLVAVGPPFAFFRYQYTQTKRLREVTPGRFYRSGQMTAEGFRETIEKYGIKLVINLQHENRDPLLPDRWLGRGKIHESELCRELGVKYVVITPDILPPGNQLDTEPPAVAEFLRELDQESNYPILIHCKAGLHRTGRLTAIYRMEKEGWSHGEALRELRAAGYGFVASSEGDEFIIQFVQNFVPRAERPKKLPVAPAPRPVRAKHAKPEGGRS
jgi:tyrosine-protein phosphatase SIW14